MLDPLLFDDIDVEYIDMVMEMANKSDERSMDSYMVVLYTHMLKWTYQIDHRGSSWMRSIRNSSSALQQLLQSKSLMNCLTHERCMKNYEKARKQASIETGFSISKFPSNIPDNWTVNNLINENFIENFLGD